MLEFKEEHGTMVYDFSLLCGEQIIIAEQAFMIHGERMNKQPANLTDLEAMTTRTSLFKALGTLLLEKTNTGEIIPFDAMKNPGIDFVKKMTAANIVKLYNGETISITDDEGKVVKLETKDGVEKDFFRSIKRSSPESMRQLNNLKNMLGGPESGSVLNLLNALRERTDLSEKSKEKTESLNQVS